MKKTELKKSHSWWWDSHISTKNSRWLTDNLEEMDKSVKRMLKLIEEDGDSFAKKAEMYYKKRPELISYIEDFYRMYRSLAERYNHVTGELRRNIPSDLQSQSSGISDFGSEPPSPNHRLSRRKSGPRAAGFEFFLGSAGSSSDLHQKEGDELSSLTDSEPESDDSSVNDYLGLGNGADPGLRMKTIELEIELREVKEKLHIQYEANSDASSRGQCENSVDLLNRIATYEQQLSIANEKIKLYSEEITRLNHAHRKHGSPEVQSKLRIELESMPKDVKIHPASDQEEMSLWLKTNVTSPDTKLRALVDELRITKERLHDSEKELASLRRELESNRYHEKIHHLHEQIESAHKEIGSLKVKLNQEKREVSKCHERTARLKSSLSDRDNEIRELRMAVSDAEEKIFPEKAEIKAKVSKLLEERARSVEEFRDLESHGRFLEEEIRTVNAEKAEMEEKLKGEIETLSKWVNELISERNEFKTKAITFEEKLSDKENQIDKVHMNFQQLQTEHKEIIAGKEVADQIVDSLRSKIKELNEEVDRKNTTIRNREEEKREAIRQLCISIDHYRMGYNRLLEAFPGHKGVVVRAS